MVRHVLILVCPLPYLLACLERRKSERHADSSFGAAFPTFYRLVGPYRSDKAEGIVKTELWDTIKRRGVIGNIFMGVIPMVRPLLLLLLMQRLTSRHFTLL